MIHRKDYHSGRTVYPYRIVIPDACDWRDAAPWLKARGIRYRIVAGYPMLCQNWKDTPDEAEWKRKIWCSFVHLEDATEFFITWC